MSPILGGRGAGVRAYGFGGAAKPNAPVSVVATDVGTNRPYNNGAASVSFASGGDNGLPITSYTVTSSPGGFTATGASSPLTVTGLQSSVQYTYTVTATNAIGTSSSSSASAGVTATTVPQAPTIGIATCATGQAYTGSANISIAFTAGATGGKAISSYTATSSSTATNSGASSPIAISQTVGSSYTYTVTATNANGTSAASSASNSVLSASVPQAPTIGTATRTGNTTVSQTFTAGATGGSAITSYAATSSPSISLSTSGTSSPITITGTFVQGTGYTFTLTATNAYGTSTASGSSNSVTPYPAPTLSAWSSASLYPLSSFNQRMGSGTASSIVWVGTGNESGYATNIGHSWNGSSWGSKYIPYNVYEPGLGNYDSQSIMSVAGVGGALDMYISTTAMLSSNTWTNKTVYPLGIANSGVTNLSDGMISVGGENAGTNSYSFNGSSWTSRVSAPYSNTRAGGASFGSTGYFVFHNQATVYSLSSVGSTYTNAATKPLGASAENPAAFFYKIGTSGSYIYHPNSAADASLNTYLFNGSTFTLATTLPNDGYANWAGGALGNTISAVPSQVASSRNHYTATLS